MQGYIHYIGEIIHPLVIPTEIKAISLAIVALKIARYLSPKKGITKKMHNTFIVVLFQLHAAALC